MGINIINPDYRNLLAIEKSRINSMGLHENKKHNNYTKAIISIFAVTILLSTMGVPIYNGIYAMESNALPMNTSLSSVNNPVSSGIPNLIAYELYNWGKIPSPTAIGEMIAGALIDLGLTYLLTAQEITTISITIVSYLLADGTSVTAVDIAIDSTALVTPGVAEALAIGIIGA